MTPIETDWLVSLRLFGKFLATDWLFWLSPFRQLKATDFTLDPDQAERWKRLFASSTACSINHGFSDFRFEFSCGHILAVFCMLHTLSLMNGQTMERNIATTMYSTFSAIVAQHWPLGVSRGSAKAFTRGERTTDWPNRNTVVLHYCYGRYLYCFYRTISQLRFTEFRCYRIWKLSKLWLSLTPGTKQFAFLPLKAMALILKDNP